MDNLINIDALLPGMVIVKITQQNGPIKIRKSGLVTSMEMVTGLGEMGVQQVEIDPAQTVEIDRPKVQKSQTQKLLESDRVAGAKGIHGADAAVSDQFNRSLFLPSVQALPSRWQYYTKPLLQGLVVVIIGFALGWGAAIAPSLLAKLTSPAAQDDAVIVEGSARGSRENASAAINANGALADDLLGSETDPGVNMPSANIGEKGLSVKPNKPDDGQTRGNQNAVNESVAMPANQPHTNTQLETTSPSEQQVNLRPEAQPELKPEASPRISSDLLKRFEKAITELDKEPEQPFEATQTKSEDTPRIDQLPAWVLTQLPPMVFTTHMYASSAQDRWVKVNNRTLHEGDMIAQKVRIEHIEPQHVILNYQGQTFSMSALSEW